VFTAIKPPASNEPSGPGLTGIVLGGGYRKTLDLALRLHPATKQVFIISGTLNHDKTYETLCQKELQGLDSAISINYLTDLSVDELIFKTKRLPERSVVLYIWQQSQNAGQLLESEDVLAAIAPSTTAPIYGVAAWQVGRGVVGGYVRAFEADGTRVGKIALRIANGARAQDIPIESATRAPIFDWGQLHRWGLKESALPPGSILLNKQPTLWDSYKWYVVGGLCLLVVQTSLIVGLLWQRATRRKTQAALKESEHRFRLVANTAPVMIWTTGTDKLCNYVNKPWLDFTGRTFEQELDNGWAEGIHSEDVVNCLKTYTEAFDKREQFEMQYRVRRHDGEYRWVFDIGVPRFNQDGSFAGYIGSCLDVTERKLAEEALSTIGRRLIEAHEEERTWIGRELHDDINQRLALLAVELDLWGKEGSRSKFSDHLSHAQSRITEIAKDVQALSHRLHSSKLDYLGLAVAARSFCKELSEKAKVEVQFSASAVPSTLPKEVSLCLFRVLQEALQNATKYSGVRVFHVNLRGIPDGLELTVSDDGIGFDEDEEFSRRGLGLISMRERLQMVHGVLDIRTHPGGGTTISARVPLQRAELRAKVG
jgi:PAS domain S-box-containing protein